jgi:hypothetical protein
MASAAIVRSAQISKDKKEILIGVTYYGDCGKHLFDLEVGACEESFPVQCRAELIEYTDDECTQKINQTIRISLDEKKLNTPYYSKGFLTITGDNYAPKKPSSARVQLPESSIKLSRK